MSVQNAAGSWGDLSTPSADRWSTDSADRELRPYRVKVGDSVYSQEEFLGDEHRFYNFTSGIGAGKTVSGILRAAANIEEWNEGEMGMIITPTTLGIKNVIMPELSKWGFLDAWEYRGPQSEEPGLHAPNGARVLLESADNKRKIERLRGPSVSWIWIDEPNNVPKKALDILLGRMRAGSYRNLFLTGTPKGYNYVHGKFVDPETRMDDVKNVLGVPSYANPHLPLDYRRDILDEYDGRFRDQEVLGEFTKFEGLVYDWFEDGTDGKHVIELDEAPDEYDEVVYGADWGHNNPAVVLALVRQGDRWTAVDEWYERRCTVNDQARAAEDLVDQWGEGTIYCDPSEPASIETLRREGLDARQAANDVMPGIQHVASMQDELRVVETCQNVRNEFNQYQYRDGGDGDRPLKQNDHAMDALRYALFSHDKHGGDSITKSKHNLGGIT